LNFFHSSNVTNATSAINDRLKVVVVYMFLFISQYLYTNRYTDDIGTLELGLTVLTPLRVSNMVLVYGVRKNNYTAWLVGMSEFDISHWLSNKVNTLVSCNN
jgi:hypothetical protein